MGLGMKGRRRGRRRAARAGARSRGERSRNPRRRGGRRIVWALAVALAHGAAGAPGSAQDTHLLLIAGLGGEPQYADAFHAWLSRFADAATEEYGIPPERIAYLSASPDLDPTRIAARSTAENIRAALARIAAATTSADQVIVFLAGHGTFRGGEARFNLPGPDLSPDDFAMLLEPLSDRTVVFVNSASASGPFLQALSAPNRAVITATRTGRERNFTRFGLHFADAFAAAGADADKDGRVSILEAFGYAAREVEREYEGDNQLLTEHAVLDDNGDAQGSRDSGPDAEDGQLARRIFLAGSASGVPPGTDMTPLLRKLLGEKADIEARIEALRRTKDQMELREYEDRLEALLVELALKNRQIRGGGVG